MTQEAVSRPENQGNCLKDTGHQKKAFRVFLAACIAAASLIAAIPITATAIGALALDSNNSTEFGLGSYYQTDFNAADANGFVYLKDGNTTGDYNSPIFDANYTAHWKTLGWEYKNSECPTGMAFIPKLNGFCIDQYEASHSDATYCDNAGLWTGNCQNSYGSSTTPASVPDRIPWVNITQTAASTACQTAGKHLCSSEEWMAAANLNGQTYNLDNTTTKNTCIVDSTLLCLNHSASNGEACNTGTNKNTNPSNCKSTENVYDLIGNVIEWTSDVVDVNTNSINNGWQYPNDDNAQSNLWYNQTPSPRYGNDGVYTSSTKTGRPVLRGGRWTDGSEAGLFSVYLSYDPSLSSFSVGFRCCKKP